MRGLRESGAAIVDMLQQGIVDAGQLLAPSLNLAGATGGAVAGPNITINIYGGGDASSVGRTSRDGVLDGLRSAGWRG